MLWMTNYTTHTAPNGPPQTLTNTSVKLSSVTIQWSRVDCLKRNSEITGYRVGYHQSPTSTVKEVNISGVMDSDRMFTITGLNPRTSYMIEVMAMNREKLLGPPANIDVQTTIPKSEYGCHVLLPNRLYQYCKICISNVGLGLLLNGVLYGNNSIVTLDEIGEDSAALFCLTNKTDCCRTSDTPQGVGVIGEWFFPDGSSVYNEGFGDDFYRGRGLSVVLLQRRNNAQTTGVFRCEVPDASGTNQQLYVGVYPVNSGSPSIIGLLYNRFTLALTCTSTGGPATTVTWWKNGAVVEVDGTTYHQSQMVVDTRTATYDNILSSADIANFIGTFTCSVSNSRGGSDRSATLNGN